MLYGGSEMSTRNLEGDPYRTNWIVWDNKLKADVYSYIEYDSRYCPACVGWHW